MIDIKRNFPIFQDFLQLLLFGLLGALSLLNVAEAADIKSFFIDGSNNASDENREYLVDRNWNGIPAGDAGSNAGQIDVGDSLRGMLNINTVNSASGNVGGTTGNNEWSAVLQVLVIDKQSLGGATFSYTLIPDPAFEANLCGGMAGCASAFVPGPGAMLVFFEDATNNFAADFDDPAPATPPGGTDDGSPSSRSVSPNISFEDVSAGPYATEEAFIATATNGQHFWTVGYSGAGGAAGPGEGWQLISTAGDNILNAFSVPTGVSVGIFNAGLTRLLNGNPGIGDDVNLAAVKPSPFGGLVQFTASGSLRGTYDLDTPFETSSDVTFAFSIAPQEELASLGDRVWEDQNNNGIQDCEDTNANNIIGETPPADTNANGTTECETGIPGVVVELGQPDGPSVCNLIGAMDITDADGFYLFDNLVPGDYCVVFTKPTEGTHPDLCDSTFGSLGEPQFTTPNAGGDDALDSDADPATGETGSVFLAGGDTNLTLDAGIVCPAKIGNFVWEDLNKNGIQDDGVGSAIDGVTVELWDCGSDGVAGTPDDIATGETRVTGAGGSLPGEYMFGAEPGVYDLPPGDYYVQFDPSTFPPGFDFTTPTVGPDDVDSDCLPPDGISSCVTLGSNEVNVDRDCGLIEPECELDIDKKCRVETPPPVDAKCDGKLKEFTVIWTGGDINISGLLNDAPGGAVSNGQEVTFTGPFDSNDVFVDITGAVTGQSKFHMSCSDKDMDGAESNDAQLQVSARDCGKDQGDAKSNGDPNFINDWLLEGFTDNSDQVLDCSTDLAVVGGSFTDSCVAAPQLVNCDTLGKPASLVFKYTGGGCSESDNSQAADKAKCTTTGDTVAGAVMIRASGKADFSRDIYIVTPDMVDPDGTFELTNNGSDLKSNSYVEITDGDGNVELNQLHTSCSQPLAVGDIFGSLTLVGFDGQSGGVDVTYQYTVSNPGAPLTGIQVTDMVLPSGPTVNVGVPFDLGTGESSTLTYETTITETTTNVGTATTGLECSASDTVTVTVEEPVIPVTCSDIKDITAVSLVWNGDNGVDVITETGETFLGIQHGNQITFHAHKDDTGNDVDLTLSGAVSGTSRFHISCSDEDMNGSEDCGSDQGNGKDNDSGLINTWLFDGMEGENGSFACELPNTGVVDPEAGGGPPPSGGDVSAAASLDLNDKDDKKVKWKLTNNGSGDVFVTEVTVTWPSQHNKLKKFKLNGDFAKDVNDTSSPTTVPDDKAFEGDANKRKLKAGESRNLEIEFDKGYGARVQGDYTITVEFDNGAQTLSFP